MTDDQPTRFVGDGEPSLADASSLKGLTRVLGLEPAQPGHDPLLGCDIGGVTIVKLIAEGGMGRVYEGKQEKPNRTVAVKVMRPGLTSPSVLKRFEYEAEVLGRLQHPGIAHIYSVGVHLLGNATVPYFVMEYIADARTLTHYANDLKLPTRQRLDLFRSVCDAVAHGHQKGVIHRDLKPSNILVDATGQPKVIDFGVARATDSDMALTTMQTDVGQLIGTLQYMSPEQFDADPNDIDIRSDVYALGVILYELLAGKPPYDVKKKAILEVMRIVKEEDPTPLSSFNRALRGDVAVIAGKCLEKDRGRRYSSASEVGADIGRYLTGEPISASPPSFIDGLTRLARRHRAAAAALAGVFAALVLAVVGIGIFASRAEQQRRVAVAAQESASVAQTKAEQEREAAEDARTVADRNAATAERATREVREKLYVANMLAIDACLKEHNTVKAAALIEQNEQMLKGGSVPIELRCARAALDTALAVFVRPAIPAEDIHMNSELGVAVDISSDSRRVAVGYRDGLVHVWNRASGKTEKEWKTGMQPLRAVKWCPDSDVVEVTNAAGTRRHFSSSTGRELTFVEPRPASPGSQWRDAALTAELSSDGMLTVRDATSNAVVGATQCDDLHRLGEQVTKAVFSPDGQKLAVATWVGVMYECVVRIWDRELGGKAKMFTWKAGPVSSGVRAILFCPDGDTVVTLCGNRFGNVWRLSSGKHLGRLSGHTEGILCAEIRPDDGTLVTGSIDGTVRTWRPEHCVETGVYVGHTCPVAAVAINGSGHFVSASLDGETRLWKQGSVGGCVVAAGSTRMVAIQFSPDGSRLAVLDDKGLVRLFDVRNGRLLHSLQRQAHGGYCDLVFSPNGRRLAVSHNNGSASIWDCETGQLAVICDAVKGHARQVRMSPNGKLLVCDFSDPSRTVVWDTETGKVVYTVGATEGGGTPVVFGLDGSRMVSSGPDILETSTGRVVARLKEATHFTRLAADAKGRRFASRSRDSVVQVWDFSSGEKLSELRGLEGDVNAVVFSPDGETIATWGYDWDHTVRLWKACTGEPLTVLKGHTGWPNAIAFSPDGRRAVSGGWDNVARIWDVASGEQLGVMAGHSDYVLRVAFSPDGQRVATCSHDGSARLWGVRLADLMELATQEE